MAGFDFGSAIGGAVGQMLSAERQRDVSARAAADQRQADEREALKSRDFSHDEAAIARDWTRDMSNTSHRREVEDLRAAGLNPILSGTGGMGASSPSGAMATSAKSAPAMAAPTDYSRITSSAIEAGRQKEEVNNIRQDTVKKVQEQHGLSARTELDKQQTNLVQDMQQTQKALTDRARFDASSAGELYRIHRADRFGRELEGAIDNSAWGNWWRHTDRAVRSLSPFKGTLR